MTNSTPKYSEAQRQRLEKLGETLLDLTPDQRQQAIKIAGDLLAIKARNRARTKAELSSQPKKPGDTTEPAPGVGISPASPLPSKSPPATVSTRSLHPKPATLPGTTRLSPSEIESLRQESREALAWMKAQRGKH